MAARYEAAVHQCLRHGWDDVDGVPGAQHPGVGHLPGQGTAHSGNRSRGGADKVVLADVDPTAASRTVVLSLDVIDPWHRVT